MQNPQFALMLCIALWLAANPLQQDSPAPSPQASPAPRLIRVSQGVMNKNLVKHPEPVYPPEAKANHIEGDVALEVEIDREGNVRVLKAFGDPALADAAIEAVKHWKYKAYLLNGETVAVRTSIKFQFHLHL